MKPILNLTLLVLLFCAGHLSASITLHCPPDQTFPCTAQSVNLMAYGDAYIMKNGKKLPAGLAHVVRSVNSCNVGTITRKWQALGDNQQILECTQTLTFLGGTFNSSHIVWPETDLQVAGCTAELDPSDLPDGYQAIILLLAISCKYFYKTVSKEDINLNARHSLFLIRALSVEEEEGK